MFIALLLTKENEVRRLLWAPDCKSGAAQPEPEVEGSKSDASGEFAFATSSFFIFEKCKEFFPLASFLYFGVAT